MGENKKLYSKHIFLFPFKWTYNVDENKKVTFDDITDVRKVIEALERDGRWEYKNLIIDDNLKYNEFVYFYDNVRNSIYSRVKRESGKKEEFYAQTVFNYEYKLGDDGNRYNIYIKYNSDKDKSSDKDKLYSLNIDSIILKIYETGIGILSYHLSNYDSEDSKDILEINDFGRRVYPQFLKTESGNIGICESLEAPKGRFLANKLEIVIDNKIKLEENFERDWKQNPYYISKTITGLFNENFVIKNPNMRNNGKVEIEPIIDDRMFTICWYVNDLLADQLKGLDHQERYNYLTSDFWHEYIFVDGNGSSCQSKDMLENLLREHTYDRWINYGTLYGASRYSFVCLTNSEGTFLETHISTMYYEMVSLLLAQRAAILRFSDEISRISVLEESKDLFKKVSVLHKNYIQFVNRLYFREVTAQEQGIEIYDLIIKCMNIDRDIKNLGEEINSLHQYTTLMEENRTSESLKTIEKLNAKFIIPTFITGLLGMNIFNKQLEDISFQWFINKVMNSLGIPLLTTSSPTFSSHLFSLFGFAIWFAVFLYWIPNLIFKKFIENNKESEEKSK
ncbi:hypothetical protein SAMN02745135_01423 [Caloranaerobacter azorensis DSM 13643]|uniref:CorA-like Mg2+ transporter protein n=1 Tax=Caloranaerobacter azorensis DSM 13643 TaxID=1121264 RepID=A0A1M5UGW1_9FIRM|nr:hypothetical protein [Caloranaerobacter azorensis]SHH62254.1 hypothetical protein SAMN02745135_01423 [Caloranaerobacter azorensis DSM 13643]